jgi:ATP-dependent NAD(P)H-hydrate dehydratase
MQVGDCMREAVKIARTLNLPIIIDGSGLNFVAQTPEIVRGYSSCLLTPNIAEFGRLAKAVGVELQGKIGVQWQQQVRWTRSRQRTKCCKYW